MGTTYYLVGTNLLPRENGLLSCKILRHAQEIIRSNLFFIFCFMSSWGLRKYSKVLPKKKAHLPEFEVSAILDQCRAIWWFFLATRILAMQAYTSDMTLSTSVSGLSSTTAPSKQITVFIYFQIFASEKKSILVFYLQVNCQTAQVITETILRLWQITFFKLLQFSWGR